MFETLINAYKVLNQRQRVRLFILQLLVIIASIFELASISSIFPFMKIITDPSFITTNEQMSYLFEYFNEDLDSLIIFLAIFILVLLLISSLISSFTTILISRYSFIAGIEIADSLLQYYLNQDYLTHLSTHSSDIVKKLTNESQRFAGDILLPSINLIAKSILIILLSLSIIYINPKIAFGAFILFSLLYLLIFFLVSNILLRNAKRISYFFGERYKIISEALGSFSDIKIRSLQAFFQKRYKDSGRVLARSLGTNNGLAQFPRFIIEFILFGGITGLILFTTINDLPLQELIPSLAVIAAASIKLIPAFQALYLNIARIKGSIASFESIRDDLFLALKGGHYLAQENLDAFDTIELKNIVFAFPDAEKNTLNKINLKFKRGDKIAIIGDSGSGKSTLIKLLCGLLDHNQGNILVNSKERSSLSCLNSISAYVPQSIFMREASLKDNIAYCIDPKFVEEKQVLNCISIASLEGFVHNLPEGIDTIIEELGSSISGGQMQRIAIARALYHDPEILFLDESTSALDSNTEANVMKNLMKFCQEKTIFLVTHRLETIKNFDKIIFLSKGEIIAFSNYSEINKLEAFKLLSGKNKDEQHNNN